MAVRLSPLRTGRALLPRNTENTNLNVRSVYYTRIHCSVSLDVAGVT
jgi:hypothetical protein